MACWCCCSSLGSAKLYSPTGRKKNGNNILVELRIGHIRDAHDVIGMQPEKYTPVTIVPERAATEVCCCPCCYVAIPAGFTAIVSKWGADVQGNEQDGSWSPGFHCFWPCCHSVTRLVSKQLIVFDTPVQECKTGDNITVHIDVQVVFEIVQAADFVYGLGPEKLDDLLRASQEELLRSMASGIMVQNIFDLHGANTDPWVQNMNAQFNQYGVKIHSFTVRNVDIPEDMAADFEAKTLYESKTLEKKMQQESDRLALNNDEEQQKLKEVCENARMAAEEQAVTAKAQITKEVREVTACTKKELALREAKRIASTADETVTCDLEVAKIQAKILQLKSSTAAKMDEEVGKLEAEAEAYSAGKRAHASVEASAKIAMGTKGVAEAEGAAATAFAARRAQEQELKRLEIIERLTTNSKIKIVTSLENNSGLAPDNSLVSQIAQQGMEAFRMKLAEMTANSVQRLEMGKVMSGGLLRPVPQVMT